MQATNKAVYIGRLMSPQQIDGATLARTDVPENVRRGWCLCGDVTEEFWRALLATQEKHRGFRLSAFTAPSGSAYVMFTIQLRAMQCRFLLSLGDNNVIKFIEESRKTGIWLSLGRDDGQQAILQPFFVNPAHLEPIVVLAHRCKVLPPAETLFELQLAAFEAMKSMTVPSAIPEFEVKQVSLNIIAPD